MTLEIARAQVVVRDGVATDYPALTGIVAGSYKEYESYLAQAAYAQYLGELLQLERAGLGGRTVVAEQAGRIVGTASYLPDGPGRPGGWPAGWVVVRAVSVEAAARGHGVGRRLIEACAGRARAAAAQGLCLHVSEAMGAALLFFDRLGFQRVRRFDLPPAADPATGARRAGPWSWGLVLPLA